MAEAGGGVELFHGLPSLTLHLPCGDSARVLLHGAQLVSWVSRGRERLYLSPRARFDGRSAVRGGVPVCFPQFNQRGRLPKHGFARQLAWQPIASSAMAGEEVRLGLRLSSNPVTLAIWPRSFVCELTVALRPGGLQITLAVQNTDAQPIEFTGALHTYLAVDDIAHTILDGLAGQPEWDAVSDRHGHGSDGLRFDGEFDRVYAAATRPLRLRDGPQTLELAQSDSWAQTVVWNPGSDKGTALDDLPAGGWQRMVCVEAAQVMQPVMVAPGAVWSGWQCLTPCAEAGPPVNLQSPPCWPKESFPVWT